jgi:hypothetical protein
MAKKHYNRDVKSYLAISPKASNRANVDADTPEQAVERYATGFNEKNYYAYLPSENKVYWVVLKDGEYQVKRWF